MPEAKASERFIVSSRDSCLSLEGKSTLHAMNAKVGELGGLIEAALNPDGSIAENPKPKMHIEFAVEQLRTGNSLQDREMWKLVDSRRFPRVSADLRDVTSIGSGRYTAKGDVTLAGRVRTCAGEFTLSSSSERLTLEGELTLDIREFGIKPPNLVLVRVDPFVRVHLRLVASKAA